MHLYLWILRHGDTVDNDEVLSPVTFPWSSAVRQVDHVDNTIKWNTIINNLPLSLILITVGVMQQVHMLPGDDHLIVTYTQRLPRKLYEFIQLPTNRNRKLIEFPSVVQEYFTEKR